MSAGPTEHIARLKRRRDYLFNRVKAAGKLDLTYDRAELSALVWAIKELEGQPTEAEEDAIDWTKAEKTSFPNLKMTKEDPEL